MLGIVIAVIIAAASAVIGGHTMEAAFLSGLGFLWVWYWIWAIVTLVVIGLIMLAVMAGTTILGAGALGWVGGFLGLAGGAAMSALAIVLVSINNALLLGGTYLLMTAGTSTMTFAEFSTNKLIFGTLLLVIGLVMSRSSSSSSSND